MSPFLFCKYVHLYHFFFNSTYKWYHLIFVFLWLISLSMIIPRSIHVAATDISSLFFYGLVVFYCVYICIYTTSSLSSYLSVDIRFLLCLGCRSFLHTHTHTRTQCVPSDLHLESLLMCYFSLIWCSFGKLRHTTTDWDLPPSPGPSLPGSESVSRWVVSDSLLPHGL